LQLLVLLCPDFPNEIVEEAIQLITPDSTDPTKEEIYQQYDIKDLQLSVALFFYYSEFFASPLMAQLKSGSMDMQELYSRISKNKECAM
jgi:hypothetical protein